MNRLFRLTLRSVQIAVKHYKLGYYGFVFLCSFKITPSKPHALASRSQHASAVNNGIVFYRLFIQAYFPYLECVFVPNVLGNFRMIVLGLRTAIGCVGPIIECRFL
jgi:hypothetical protein